MLSLVGALLLSPAAEASQPATAPAAVADAVPGRVVPAADLSKFQPGNIISDAKFYDRNTMTEAQIQQFLEARLSRCSTGYTCLQNYFDTSRTTAADAMCGAYQGGVRERASAIIFKVAQACGINPQVILVMLQKEQGLVLSSAPSAGNYRAAMGQGCPDTAACDSRYYGFFNQVYGGAWQLKRYSNPPGTSLYFTWYAPGKTWHVRFHPNAACGSSPVFIQNQATASLYYYTPYQPNAAAIRAGYGEATDACASYGNRNFYQFFTDWFGAPQGPVLTTVAEGSYVAALDPAGTLWGYPVSPLGHFGVRTALASGLSGYRSVLPVADFDGDGHRDVIGVTTAGVAMLLPGIDADSLGPAVRIGDWSKAVLTTSAGDFDGDGSPDLFTTDAAGSLLLWRGTNARVLATPVVAGTGWNGIDMVSGGVDLSGDGIPDLIARTTDGTLRVYFGNGTGRFNGSLDIGSGWGSMTAVFTPGDVTGDRVADVAARDSAGVLHLYRGVGGGRISTVGVWDSGWGDMVMGAAGPPTAGIRSLAPGAGDLNNDSEPDAVALTAAGELVLYRGTGRGGWYPGVTVGTGWPTGSSLVTVGDFSGDGRPDLLRLHANGDLFLLRGTGGGDYEAPAQIGHGWNSFKTIVGGIDFDGDRKPDVIALDAAGNLLLYRGNGAGGWAGAATIIGTGWEGMTALVAAGDFDGDRRPDLFARDSAGNLWLYPTKGTGGTGGWLTPKQIGSGWQDMTALIGPGDFDGAGGMDLIARTASGELMLYRGNGRGGWSGSSVIGWGWGSFTDLG